MTYDSKQIKGLKSLVLGEVDLFSVQNHSKIKQNEGNLHGNAHSDVNSIRISELNNGQCGSTRKELKI